MLRACGPLRAVPWLCCAARLPLSFCLHLKSRQHTSKLNKLDFPVGVYAKLGEQRLNVFLNGLHSKRAKDLLQPGRRNVSGAFAVDAVERALKLRDLVLCEHTRGEGNCSLPALSGAQPPDPCLLYTSPSPRDRTRSRMPSSA